ncbi:MAG: methyltransferase domain-containing protein [bacterium]
MAGHVCPWWLGYFLASPVRRIFEKPEELLSLYINSGMHILEIGPGMGFFSLPMAEMTGPDGIIYCVDLQDKMLKSLEKRAVKKKLIDRIECRKCSQNSLEINDLKEKIDFILAYAVVHEIPDKTIFFSETYSSLKAGCKLLMADPKFHVSEEEFNKTVLKAEEAGFKAIENPNIWRSRSVVFIKDKKAAI